MIPHRTWEQGSRVYAKRKSEENHTRQARPRRSKGVLRMSVWASIPKRPYLTGVCMGTKDHEVWCHAGAPLA